MRRDGLGRPHCISEPPNHRALAHVTRRAVCLEQIATMHLIETQPVHSHDDRRLTRSPRGC